MDAYAQERARLQRLWANTVPIADAKAVGGRTYLQRRGIPAAVAVAACVRYAGLWGSIDLFTGPAVVFPMQDADGKLVAAEGRFMTPPADVATTYRAGAKGGGVFQAMPGALDAVGVTLVEGPVTALSVAACGYQAVALCGSTMPTWLAPRLAPRDVMVSLDWYEMAAEATAVPIFRALAAAGAKPYRLAPPAGRDWNDYLQAVGLEMMHAELDRAIVAALVPRG